jgi:4-hydroxy-3-methylbut-2-enyl diphosphate reductase
VCAVIERLKQLGIGSVENLDGAQERVAFALPKGLA